MHVARRRILGPIPAIAWWMAAAVALAAARPAGAQSTDDAPLFTPDELEELVAPIALYPDDLVAIVLPAATYPLDVVEAARFLDELESGASVTPDEDWDDSIVALLNYPEVLRRMDQDLDWTWDLGEAFLSQQADVLDAIQRFRTQARAAGNLESDERVRVAEDQGAIRITPADPEVIYVPYYEPREVVVHHHHHHHPPIRYYPRPYPVYYYPYPAGYSFWSGHFWGVTTAFVVGWHTHHLHVHHHLHVGHPYHRHRYHDPFYVRRSISINIVNIDRDVYVWKPRHHRIGGRPGRVTVTREGAVRADYGSRRYVRRGDEGRRTVTTTERRAVAGGERTIGRIASGERRSAAASTSRTARPANARSPASRAGAAAGARTRSSAAGAAQPSRSIGRIAPSGESQPAAAGQSRAGAASRPSENRGATRSTLGGVSSSRGTASPSRSAVSPTSRSTARSTSRSTARSTIGGVSPNRIASPDRGARSPSRTAGSAVGAVSPGRDGARSYRSTASAYRGTAAASPSRAAAQPRAAASSRGTTARSTRAASSRSAVSAGRQAASVRGSSGPSRGTSTGRTRSSR